MAENESRLSRPDSRKEIIAKELAWHEQESRRRFSLDLLLYAPPAFDQVVQSGFAYLHMEPGEIVLDMGCGEGKQTLELARQGMAVVSMDLSHLQLCRARERLQAAAPDVLVSFIQANSEELPFAPHSFRIIYGKAILHHLDIDLSAKEVARVLKPAGRATFAEPMAHHPLFWLGRRLTPKLHTRDEHPLTFNDLCHFGTFFQQPEIEAHFLMTPLSYVFRLFPKGESAFRRFHMFLQRADRWLFGKFYFLRHLAWYGAIKVHK